MSLAQEQQAVDAAQAALDKYGPFILIPDAAKLAGVPPATLYQAVREGRVPAVRLEPRGWLIRVSAIELAVETSSGLHRKRGRPFKNK